MTTPAVGAGDFTAATAMSPADVLMDNQAQVAIGPGVTKSYGPYLMTQPAYAAALAALMPANTAVGILKVTVTWSDPVTGLIVGQQRWFVASTSTAPALSNELHTGRGPTEGGQLQIDITNQDTAQTATVDLAVWQSSRVVTRHDWRTITHTAVTGGFTTPSSHPRSGSLGWAASATIPATQNTTWLCALYAGQGELFVITPQFASVTMQVSVPYSDAAVASQPFLYSQVLPTQQSLFAVTLPRCPVALELINQGGVPAIVSWHLILQEFAS